jgi:hypothetical protein
VKGRAPTLASILGTETAAMRLMAMRDALMVLLDVAVAVLVPSLFLRRVVSRDILNLAVTNTCEL